MSGKNKTILLVEDDIFVSLNQKTSLGKAGYTVLTAHTGEDAVDKINNTPGIDLILMDIDLGDGIDGTRASQIILEKYDIPIVFLSSHTEPEIVEKTEKITSYGYVVKNSAITVLDASIKMAFKLFEAKLKHQLLEKELSYNKILLQAAFDQSPVPMALTTYPDYSFKIINTAAENFLLVDAADYINKKPLEIDIVWQEYTPEGRKIEVTELPMPLALQGITTRNMEMMVERKDGSKVWQLASGAPVYGEDGNLIAGLLVMVDITDRKKIEETLLEYKAAVEQSVDGIALADNNGYIRFINKAWAKMHGYTVDELIGSHLSVFHTHDQLINEVIPFNESLKINSSREGEVGHVRKDGSCFSTYMTTSVLKDAVDKPFGILGIARDIEDKKRSEALLAENNLKLAEGYEKLADSNSELEQINEELTVSNEEFEASNEELIKAQEALQESESSLRQKNSLLSALLDNLPVGVFMAEAPGGRPLIANTEAVKLLGRGIMPDASTDTLAEVYQARRQGLDGPYPVHDLPIVKAMQGESAYVDDMIVERPDGTEILLEVFGTPVSSEKGKVWAGLISFRDITDRRHAEDEIKHQLAEKEILLKEVHHRIKNNITTVASLLSLQLNKAESSEAAAPLQDALARIQSMRVLYDKLLIDDDYSEISVKNYIVSLVESIMELFPEKEKVTIEKNIDDLTLIPKKLFPLGIIINELITNIMKYAFTGTGDNQIKISVKMNDNKVALVLQDNGKGLPEDFSFDKSTGFGHMLVKMLTIQLGGTFSIENCRGTKCILNFEI